MFALRVTYLTGRVYSADVEDGDRKARPEWPPHPSRLLSALVAAWGDGGREPELRPAIEWLERQEPPEIHAGDIAVRKLCEIHVPINDNKPSKGGWLPEQRLRKERRFPSGTLSHPDVYFVWNAEPDAGTRRALEMLLQRTSSLGHSASLIAADVQENAPATGLKIWKPSTDGSARLRVAHEGRLAELEARFERFRKEPTKVNRPDRGKTALYGVPNSAKHMVRQGCFDRMIILRREAGPKASLRSTLSLTAALRGAIMSLAPQPVPEFISGHAPDSTPDNPRRSESTHIALVPLAFVDHPHATGDLLGMAALLPSSLTAFDTQVCWDVFSRVKKLETAWGWWDVCLTDAEETKANLRPGIWSRPAKVWSTVTPFVFDRFPKDPYGDEAQEVVRVAIERIGLPRPEDVDLHYNSWHTGVPKASLFPAAPARPGKPQRYHCHVRLEFAEPVRGPVAAGAGRFYGYGLFRPHADREAK